VFVKHVSFCFFIHTKAVAAMNSTMQAGISIVHPEISEPKKPNPQPPQINNPTKQKNKQKTPLSRKPAHKRGTLANLSPSYKPQTSKVIIPPLNDLPQVLLFF